MSRICGMCGKKGHNARTCKNKDTLSEVLIKKGSRIYIPKELKKGESILKSQLLKRFSERHNHKEWKNGKWHKVSLKTKIRDNKYKIKDVIYRDNSSKVKKIIQYKLESKRDAIKWTEIQMATNYNITTPVILYK